jgi:hypothetical protein
MAVCSHITLLLRPVNKSSTPICWRKSKQPRSTKMKDFPTGYGRMYTTCFHERGTVTTEGRQRLTVVLRPGPARGRTVPAREPHRAAFGPLAAVANRPPGLGPAAGAERSQERCATGMPARAIREEQESIRLSEHRRIERCGK